MLLLKWSWYADPSAADRQEPEGWRQEDEAKFDKWLTDPEPDVEDP